MSLVDLTRGDDEQRIKHKIERALPEERERKQALELLAYALEDADDERSDAWVLREIPNGLALFAGRVVVCRVRRSEVSLSVMGPISDAIRATLGAEADENEAWRMIPGGLFLTLHAEKAAAALELLKAPFSQFVDLAMGRVRRAVSQENHLPGAVDYLSSVVGRTLPQPSPSNVSGEEDQDDQEDGEGQDPGLREPKIRGRAPMFEHGQRSVTSLISDVERQIIALPDLQRPFVWEDTKVRDLLDSIFVGYPVGTLVLWHIVDGKPARTVGGDSRAPTATALVIDGQQRLTSLYAVMRSAEVTDKNGAKRRITIAFRPRDGRFAVADAAIRNDPEFLPDIAELWKNVRSRTQIVKQLLAGLRERGRPVDEAYENAVAENLDRAYSISEYRFPVVEIRKTAAVEEANEEDVAEIFVRINNQGKRLGNADFVLTLLSVFHGDLRDRIEQRASEMSVDAVVAVDTQQLLRATCAVAFGRARMSAIYRFLRGIDPTSGDTNLAHRLERLETLGVAADECMAKTTWRDYLLRVSRAGIVAQGLVASSSAVINAYAFYVLGRRAGLQKPRLDDLVSRWLFGTLLSARYSTSSETVFEQDLARVRSANPGDGGAFERALDAALSETFTGDYWNRTVIGALETQRSSAPAALAYRAAQVVIGARALFSDQPLQNLLAPPGKGSRSASEAHHLFPQAWLAARGVKDRRQINQVANLADIGWYENGAIGSSGPAEYVPRLREKLRWDEDRWGRACAEHALPVGWESMHYEQFLRERRQRMAEIIRVAFRQLGGESETTAVAPPWFLPGADLVWRKIVDTERALRAVVRDVYSRKFGDSAAKRIEEGVPAASREALTRALRARPAGADPLSVVDYLYLAQLPALLFANEVWQEARAQFGGGSETKQKLVAAVNEIAPVRNEIAHVREVSPERLQRANVACGDILKMVEALR